MRDSVSPSPRLLLQQEAAQLAGERARDAARHARAQHLVPLAALLVARQPQRRDAALEQRREVVLDRAKHLDARRRRAATAPLDLGELGHVIAVSVRTSKQSDKRVVRRQPARR